MFILLRQRIISIVAVSLLSLIGLQSLALMNNLYQPAKYIRLAIFVYAVLLFWLYFIFDLHFKQKTVGGRGLFAMLTRRFIHVLNWRHLRHFVNFLILPGIIYWSSVIMISINFGHRKLQQFIVFFSAVALVISYSLFKEIFHIKKLPVHNWHFAILSYVKIYAAWLLYAATLGVVWYYCLPLWSFCLTIFLATFALLYQALFQSAKISARNITVIAIISLVMALGSFFVYRTWNINYFTAGLLLAGSYNFLWSNMFYGLNGKLTFKVFLENLIIFILIAAFVLGVTNFGAKIDRC